MNPFPRRSLKIRRNAADQPTREICGLTRAMSSTQRPEVRARRLISRNRRLKQSYRAIDAMSVPKRADIRESAARFLDPLKSPYGGQEAH